MIYDVILSLNGGKRTINILFEILNIIFILFSINLMCIQREEL